jgi:hypothetical protein
MQSVPFGLPDYFSVLATAIAFAVSDAMKFWKFSSLHQPIECDDGRDHQDGRKLGTNETSPRF